MTSGQDVPPSIPVVGIGGSAGALEAFEAFFGAMPADSGAAFVVVQHMAPGPASLLSGILAQHTRMPVLQAQDGVPVERDHVYIIPPGRHLACRKGVLHLSDPSPGSGTRMTIDSFFRSLADDCHEQAVCILFSGAGSDGTLGARAVQGAGGMVVVQDPQTAQFPDMPLSAVSAGLVDYVLVPERMPDVLLHYLHHPFIRGQERATLAESQGQQGDLEDILRQLLAQTGCTFGCYKKTTVLRRIARRMVLRRISGLSAYRELLHREPDEVRALYHDLLINVTTFFRDVDAFEALREKVIGPMVGAKPNDEPLRTWVPGCATGEEAYSLAMLLIEERVRHGKSCPVHVFATDLDEEALAFARRGFYPESIQADVGEERLGRFFTRHDHGYQVKEALRNVVTFAVQNAISNPPFSRLDLVSCRNLLIYLDTDTQKKMMTLLNFALNPGGYLFLGKSESVGGEESLFEPVSRKLRIYRRLFSARPLILDAPFSPGTRRTPLPPPTHRPPGGSHFADVIRVEMLRHFGASAVLVDAQGEVMQFHGQVEKYLRLPVPGPTFQLLDLARGRLSSQLRLAMHKAVGHGERVVLDRVAIENGGKGAFARVTVSPVMQAGPSEPLLVVFFEDAREPARMQAARSPEEESIVRRLEDELRVSQEDVRSTVEELQSANAALRATNEEATFINEELQSANEEYVTSVEELHATNEELTAVIGRLQEKVELLDQANSDITRLREVERQLAAIVESSNEAIFTKSLDGTILTWNQAAERLYGHSRQEAVGGNLSMLIPPERGGEYAALMERSRSGERIEALETERVRKGGRRIDVSLSISPIRDDSGQVIAASVIARDIGERKRAEEALRKGEERFRILFESSPNALMLAAADGLITLLNRRAETMFGYTRGELLGQALEILVPAAVRPRHAFYRAEFVVAPAQRPMGAGRDLFAVRKDGSEFPVEIGLTPIEMAEGLVTLATITDITERTGL